MASQSKARPKFHHRAWLVIWPPRACVGRQFPRGSTGGPPSLRLNLWARRTCRTSAKRIGAGRGSWRRPAARWYTCGRSKPVFVAHPDERMRQPHRQTRSTACVRPADFPADCSARFPPGPGRIKSPVRFVRGREHQSGAVCGLIRPEKKAPGLGGGRAHDTRS